MKIDTSMRALKTIENEKREKEEETKREVNKKFLKREHFNVRQTISLINFHTHRTKER
jgi:hypothetical protein